jgi:hypothetical protein
MKAQFKVTSTLIVELEAGDPKSLFEELAQTQEIFGQTPCGKCSSKDVKFVVRTVNDNDFYEVHCTQCKAKLQFGAHKNGKTLFPKRKDADGNWIGSNGWGKWNPETEKVE